MLGAMPTSRPRPVPRAPSVLAPLAALALTLAACVSAAGASGGRGPPAPAAGRAGASGGHDAGAASPYVLVLGTAQDAGLPQIGCTLACCEAARADPSRRRLVASLLVVAPRSGSRWLIDATPDLPEQVERMRGHPPTRIGEGPRPPLVDGIFLTHAHVGHYAGLLQLGREAYAADAVPLRGPPSLGAFLANNAPWSLLLEQGHVTFTAVPDGGTVALADDLSVTALRVPHRDELSATYGYLVRGPSRALLYVPDVDEWERWERDVGDLLDEVDVALLDGTFFAGGEIPGRAMADIPHPFVVESIERLAPLAARDGVEIVFTHLNHTNPAADEDGAAAARVRAAGMRVAREGEVIGL